MTCQHPEVPHPDTSYAKLLSSPQKIVQPFECWWWSEWWRRSGGYFVMAIATAWNQANGLVSEFTAELRMTANTLTGRVSRVTRFAMEMPTAKCFQFGSNLKIKCTYTSSTRSSESLLMYKYFGFSAKAICLPSRWMKLENLLVSPSLSTGYNQQLIKGVNHMLTCSKCTSWHQD